MASPYELYKKAGICHLPIAPSRIAKANQIALLTYDEFAKLSGDSVFELVNEYGPDGFSQYIGGRAAIIYNRNRHHSRVRWTLGHELSHYELGHVDLGGAPICRSDKRDIYDAEADRLTAQLLCPLIVVNFCGVHSAYELQRLTFLSRSASDSQWIRLCEARERYDFFIEEENIKLLQHFQSFINQYLDQHSTGSINIQIECGPRCATRY